MGQKRKIAVITGTRAEYGYLTPILEEIRSDGSLELQLIVTGMHLSREHGYTCRLIENDGFKIKAKVKMLSNTNKSKDMARSIGIGIAGIAKDLAKLRPDIVLVFGDRLEALAGAIAASYLNIVIAHIHGGDKSKGDIDERARHAITKLAHLHFPATKMSGERIIKLGERPRYVFVVGSSTVDTMKRYNYLSKGELVNKYGISKGDYMLVLQNPVTTEPRESYSQMVKTIKALNSFDLDKVLIEPNSDAGYKGIKKAIKEMSGQGRYKIFTNLERLDYLSLLKNAKVLIGNSSSGIIEASFFKVPVVNIGIRQSGRERSNNIIDAQEKSKEIMAAINKALNDRQFKKRVKQCKNIYGDGRSSGRIVKILKRIMITKDLLQKQIIY